MAHRRQPRPDSGLGFQVKVLQIFQVVPSTLGSGRTLNVGPKGNANSHGARPVHLIITMVKWIRTSRLSIKNSLSDGKELSLMALSLSAGDIEHPELDEGDAAHPLSSEYGTYKTIKTRFWPWLSGKRPWRDTARAEDAQGTPVQSHISPSIL